MESDYLSILTLVGIGATCIGSGIAIIKACYWYQDRKPVFAYELLREKGIWYLRIQHNDKIINKMSVTMDNSALQFQDQKGKYERVMRINEGQNFEIGAEPNPYSDIVIKYDKYKIKKKFSEITVSKDSS